MAKRPSGIGTSIPHAKRKADGRVRVEVYLSPKVAAALERGEGSCGNKTRAISAALLFAFGEPKPTDVEVAESPTR